MRGCAANGSLDESQFAKPLPTIGLYVAGASLYCATAMAVDAFRGFRTRRLWFPSRYFTLNAATVTVLAAAVKLPLDLNTSMPRAIDQLSKLSGTVLICTVMGNLIPSLGVIDNAAANIVALGILVVTVIVNVVIQMGTGVIYVYLPEHAVIAFFMMVLLILMTSSALTVSTVKRQLEKLYDLKHEKLAGEEDDGADDKYEEERLKKCVEKYWLMAHSSSPQYVLGRSATCTASGAFCLLSALVLVEATARSRVMGRPRFCTGQSDYGWSIILVYLSQGIAVAVGTVAPAVRWFAAISYRSPRKGSWRDEFRLEKFWVEKLTEWKEAPLRHEFKNWRCQKITQNSKNLFLGLLIKVQIGVVLVSKVVRLVSVLPVSWINQGRKLFRKLDTIPSSVTGSSSLEEFVLHLEGEEDLVKLITRSERKDTKKWIQEGKKTSPTHLASLIRSRIHSAHDVSPAFVWVSRFDSDEVPRLAEGKEAPHCWVLPVVTLASIAVALPGVDQSSLKPLLSGVGEGLRYVRQVENQLEAKGLLNQRKAADMVWSRLSLYNRWFDWDLRRLTPAPHNSREVIGELRRIGETLVREFLDKGRDGLDRTNALDWPPKVLAANCMYRLTSTILLHRDRNPDGETQLFCYWLRPAISDLLCACLTNLPKAVYMECFCNAIETREERVRDAAFLLGETREIMSLLAAKEAASSFPKKKAYVDDWREKIRSSRWEWSLDYDNCSALASTSNTMSASLSSISSSTISSSTKDEPVRPGELTQEAWPLDMV